MSKVEGLIWGCTTISEVKSSQKTRQSVHHRFLRTKNTLYLVDNGLGLVKGSLMICHVARRKFAELAQNKVKGHLCFLLDRHVIILGDGTK
ncbi:hypothetical protein L2E82_51778 [Cichorium intybus]|nr:hypothetical protein L2E82_51778 [Cichorium intybus]